jgi:hypothetical protein
MTANININQTITFGFRARGKLKEYQNIKEGNVARLLLKVNQ